MSLIVRCFLFGILLLAAFASATGENAEGGSCSVVIVGTDPEGDTVLVPGERVEYPTPAADLIGLSVRVNETTIHVQGNLLHAPPRSTDETYRYWLGWYARLDDAEPEYMGLRFAGTHTYDTVSLVGPNSFGNPGIGEYPATWNGSTVAVIIPKADVLTVMNRKTIELESVEAQADGPHRIESNQGFGTAAPYVIDRLAQTGDAERSRECPQNEEVTQTYPVPNTREVSLPLWVMGPGILAASWMRRKDP